MLKYIILINKFSNNLFILKPVILIMAIDNIPDWMSNFSAEDMEFVKRLILSSGSLKELSKIYGVSYPTIRLRLDRLISCIELSEKPEPDSFISFIKLSVINGKLNGDLGKEIIYKYKQQLEDKNDKNF